jgi:hypothetical protein
MNRRRMRRWTCHENEIGDTCKSGPQLDTGRKKDKSSPQTTWRRMMEDELSTTSMRRGTALKVVQNRKEWSVFWCPHVPLGMAGLSK